RCKGLKARDCAEARRGCQGTRAGPRAARPQDTTVLDQSPRSARARRLERDVAAADAANDALDAFAADLQVAGGHARGHSVAGHQGPDPQGVLGWSAYSGLRHVALALSVDNGRPCRWEGLPARA